MLLNLIQPVYAQCNPSEGAVDLAQCLKLSDSQQVSEVYTSPAFLVNLVVRNIFVVAGIVLFFMIILAGFKFIKGGKDGLEEAKKVITQAVVGFLIMFSAYWIVQIIALITGANITI